MEKGTSENRIRHSLRVLRPLFWWLIVVLVLFGIRTHQRLLEKTQLTFSVSLQGQAIDAAATVDGKPVFSGQNISLGSHIFAVRHPKAESFSTNLFIWYGEHNLGDLVLKRGMGTLSVSANPAAVFIDIRGPEFSLKLTNSTGTTITVPTDRYRVEAQYSHWQQAGEVIVFPNAPGTWTFAPRFGVLQMSCGRSGASFQLQGADGRLIEAGELPSVITELPEGSYKLIAQHHGHQRERRVEVNAGVSNNFEVEFVYGTAVFETVPEGATVRSENGDLGTTPLRLSELEPGVWTFGLRREGYEPVLTKLEIVGNQTSTLRTNLVNTTYLGAVNRARRYLAAGDYETAVAAATDALQVKPNDADAITLQKEALGQKSLRRAETLGKQGDYIGGIKELELTLQSLPDNEEAKQLERLRQERLALPKQIFDSSIAREVGSNLYETHELKTSKPSEQARAAIMDQLKSGAPNFKVTRHISPTPETFLIEASQEFSGGSRWCLIVGGQTKDDETRIYFKVLESKKDSFMHQNVGSLFGTAPTKYVDIDPTQSQLSDKLKNQIADGVSNVTARIQQAIGLAPGENQ
jgi:PEGA domain